MRVNVKLGDEVLGVEKGKCYCYGVDREGVIFEHFEISHDEYKECVRSDRFEKQESDISNNVVLHYEDNGGVFFVKSKQRKKGQNKCPFLLHYFWLEYKIANFEKSS